MTTTNPTKKELYASNKKVKRFQDKITLVRSRFNEADIKCCDFERLRNAQPSELNNLKNLLKEFVSMSQKEDELIAEGLVQNEELKEPKVQPNEALLDALRNKYPPRRKYAMKLKHDFESKQKFRKEIFARHTDLILQHVATPEIIVTIDAFRQSIDISKYVPTSKDYEEAQTPEPVAESPKKAKQAKPVAESPKKAKQPKPVAESPKKAKQPKPVAESPKKAKQPKPVAEDDPESDIEDFVEQQLKEESTQRKGKKKKVNETKYFKQKLFSYYGQEIIDKSMDDPGEDDGVMDKICKEYVKKCQAVDSDNFIQIKRFSVTHPRQALGIIKKIYLDGQSYMDEQLEL
jgi:hypothetical protein